MLQELPAWLMRLEVGDLLGVIAYTQVFALLETLLVWGMIMLLTFILPWRLSGERFIPLISSLIFIHALWAGALHSAFGAFRALGSLQLLLVLAIYLLSVTGAVLLSPAFRKVQRHAPVPARTAGGTRSAIYHF
jgi:hypothetical protein